MVMPFVPRLDKPPHSRFVPVEYKTLVDVPLAHPTRHRALPRLQRVRRNRSSRLRDGVHRSDPASGARWVPVSVLSRVHVNSNMWTAQMFAAVQAAAADGVRRAFALR